MDKLNRNIDEQRMNKSKINTIDSVMNSISATKKRRFSLSFSSFRLASILSVVVIAIVSILVLDPFNTNPPVPSPPVVLTEFETQKLAELSYFSGRLIVASFSLNNQSSLLRLSDDNETEFEANIDEFNTYFDMLKVFLDDNTFSDSVTVTTVDEGDYDTSIEFYVDGKLYTFLVIVIDEEITGELTINSQVFTVEGTYEETDTELKMEITASDGKTYVTKHYNLDAIISVGYRVNSKQATQFRIWATSILRDHMVQGYTINKTRIEKNYTDFLRVIDDIKILAHNSNQIKPNDVLELIKSFSATWFGLDSYDREELPKEGITKVNLEFEVEKLYKDISTLKQELIRRGEAAEIFATEKTKRSLEGIFGNVFQSVFGEDAYPTVEEKAAHLLYFVVKNHPFNDGNKRCGAFSFIWLLKRAGFSVEKFINPNALTALTLLIAESNPNDKNRMVGLVLLMLKDV